MFRAAHKNRPRSELLEPAIGATETAVGGQQATSHSMGDLLSFPQQAACCQDFIQPGAIPSRRIVEASVYRNQIDQGFPRVDDFDEYRSMRQDPFSVFRQRGAYPVDEREHVPRPSTPTVSPARLPRNRMPCPLISVTNDNDISSVIYQDESDASDDKIVEEEENNTELDKVAMNSLNYSTDTLNPFIRITAPPREYAEAADDYKNDYPLTLDRNVFDAIPYIDQTDDNNLAEYRAQIESSDKCERYKKTDRNSNLGDSQKHIKVDCNSQHTLNIPRSNFEISTCSNLDVSSIDTRSLPANKSVLPIATIESTSEFKLEDTPHLQSANNTATYILNVDERCEDKVSDDVSNSEDCADESSSTINDECASSRVDEDAEEGISTPTMYTVMPELHLDLSGLNSDVSSDESKIEKCWKSPEEVRLGCGRVAALAKHFSKLGDAGLIKFKSTKLTDSRQFVSEPNIILSEKDSERYLHQSLPIVQKEYKSDSNLTRNSANKSSRIGKRVILVDVEADNDLAIEECHHHGAKRVIIARIPLMDNKDQIAIDTKEGSDLVTSIENTSSNNSKDQVYTEKDAILAKIEDNNMMIGNDKSQVLTDVESTPIEKINIKDSGSKLSLEQQRVIAKQLEQFSNLDNTDAPLFIPERSVKLTSSKSENNVTSNGSNLAHQSAVSREKLSSLINTDDSSRRTKQVSNSSSSSSPPSPSSSILPLSNVVENPPFSEDVRTQTRKYCKEQHKSCLLIDICHSSAKIYSNSSKSPSTLPSCHASARSGDNKLNILRVRIARSLCSSENNLIGAALCEKEENFRGGSAKLTSSCESILNSNFSSDSADRLSENLSKDIDSLRTSCNRSCPKEKTRWYRPRSLEELKLKKESKQDNSTNSISAQSSSKVQTRISKFFGDKSDSKNREEMRRNRHLSLEELRSKKESRERNSRKNSSEIAEIQRSDWTLKKRFRSKLRTSCNQLRGSALELSRGNETSDEKRQRWGVGERECRSELDVSRRESDSERDGWSFREISSMRKLPPRVFLCIRCAFSRIFLSSSTLLPEQNKWKIVIPRRINVAQFFRSPCLDPFYILCFFITRAWCPNESVIILAIRYFAAHNG